MFRKGRVERVEIRIVNLTDENLGDVPEWGSYPFSCKYCIYWEFPQECVTTAEWKNEKAMRKKLKWLRDTIGSFGNCGKLLYVNERVVGYAQYAFPRFLPRSLDYPAGPPDMDAVLISCLFILYKEFRGSGLGRQLLHSIIEDLRGRKISAVETFARKGNPDNPSGPMEFYLKNGFRICRDDREFPLMRLDM